MFKSNCDGRIEFDPGCTMVCPHRGDCKYNNGVAPATMHEAHTDGSGNILCNLLHGDFDINKELLKTSPGMKLLEDALPDVGDLIVLAFVEKPLDTFYELIEVNSYHRECFRVEGLYDGAYSPATHWQKVEEV